MAGTTVSEQLCRWVETHHIDMIPAGARHGRPWNQFAFWWGCNVNVFNVVLGAVVVTLGLSLWWALVVMATGVLVALAGYRSFVTNLSNFPGVLLVLFIPWSAVNLAG